MVEPEYLLLLGSHFSPSLAQSFKLQFVKDTSAKLNLILGIKVLLDCLVIHLLQQMVTLLKHSWAFVKIFVIISPE